MVFEYKDEYKISKNDLKSILLNRHRRWLFMFSACVYACADFAITRGISRTINYR